MNNELPISIEPVHVSVDGELLEAGRGGENDMFEFFHALRNREEGQALVEYALILALVSVVAIGALQLLGTNVTGILNQIAAAV